MFCTRTISTRDSHLIFPVNFVFLLAAVLVKNRIKMYNVTSMVFFKFLGYLYGGVLCSVHYSKMSFDDQFAEEMSSSSSHGFQITRKAKKRKIDAATYPEVLEMSGEFDKEVPETVVQKHFFDRQNERTTYKHVSPWDHSFVASFIQRSPIPTFNMNDMCVRTRRNRRSK